MADANHPENDKVVPIEDLDKLEGTVATSERRSSASPPDDPDALVLECPICLQPCVHPVELPCKHIFCFLCIKGVAMQGPHGRCAICRSNIPHNVLTHPRLKDISQLFKHVKTTTSGYEWYYEARGGGWWQYDERSMQELERAFESQQTSCQLLIAGLLYEIDFGQMVQYRQNNRNLFRRIKRDVPSAEKRGIAGIRLGRNGDNSSSQNSSGGGGNSGSAADGTAQTQDNGRRGRGGRSRGSFNRSSRQGGNNGDSLAASDSELTSIENVVVLSESESDNAEDEEDSGDDPDYLEDEEEEDMELGEEEELRESSDEEADVDGELRGSAIRDGARAPTSRSDRSNSSTTQTPPPNEASNGGGGSSSSPRNQNSSPNSNPSGRRSRGARSDRSSGGSRSKSGLGSGGNGSVNNPDPSSSASSPEVPPPLPPLLMGGIKAVSATNIRISSAPSSLETCSSANFSLDPNPNINGSYNNLTNINGSSRSSITTTADFTCLLIGPGVRITLDQHNPTNDEEIL